jgi:hypothetical protein
VVVLTTSSPKDIVQQTAQRRMLDMLCSKQIAVEVVDGARAPHQRRVLCGGACVAHSFLVCYCTPRHGHQKRLSSSRHPPLPRGAGVGTHAARREPFALGGAQQPLRTLRCSVLQWKVHGRRSTRRYSCATRRRQGMYSRSW